jgi:hypothetical protein
MGISVAIVQPSSALPDGLQNLFVNAMEREGARASTEPSVVRTRAVRVSVDLIAPPPSRRPDRLRFNLFDDLSFLAVFERSEVRSPSSYTWFGRLAHEEYSSFILVVEQGVVAGSIRVPGKGVYQIGSLGAGVHVIREIDESRLPPCEVKSAERTVAQVTPIPCAGPNITCVDDGSQIDVLVVYTALARAEAGGTAAIDAAILAAFEFTNDLYATNLINTRLNLVLAAEIDYDESEPFPFTNLIDPNDGVMDEVHVLRDDVHADLVELIVKNGSGNVGQLMSFGQPVENYGFTKLVRSFGLLGMVHEIGHNMGCAHRRIGNNAGFFEYSFGHLFFGDSGTQWHTLMSGGPGTGILQFSNPNVLFDGQPTGIPAGQPNSADNVRTINETALMIANIRPSVPPDCNGNGVPDDEDIANGTSDDENNNGVPDVCDIVLHVDAGAAPGGDGRSWATAYNDLQDALLDAACPCATVYEIWVAAGTYIPDRGTGDRNASFFAQNIAIYGGFSGNETSFAERAGLFEQTILSGDLNGDDGPDFQNNDENSYTVVMSLGTDARAVLDGFTVTAGNADGDQTGMSTEAGGGLFITSSSLTLRNCHIIGNTAKQGAGIEAHGFGSTATLVNCTISENKAMNESPAPSFGGGISSFTTLRLINCEVTNNLADRGGGLYQQGGTALLANCVFSGNTSISGAGLFGQEAVATVINSTFSTNSAASQGGGVYLFLESTLTLHNSVLWNNTDTAGANSNETAQIFDEPVFGANVVSVEHSCVQDDDPGDASVYPGTGNIDDDPLFVDMSNGDLHLSRSPVVSPALDAGNDAAVPAEVTSDLDGNPRFVRGVDMGAYELQDSPTSVDDPVDDAVPWVTALGVVHPNPFNSGVEVAFTLAKAEAVEITVYDVLGRRVVTFLRETKGVGKHSVVWNGKDTSGRSLASGVYFVRLKAGSVVIQKKLVLVR